MATVYSVTWICRFRSPKHNWHKWEWSREDRDTFKRGHLKMYTEKTPKSKLSPRKRFQIDFFMTNYIFFPLFSELGICTAFSRLIPSAHRFPRTDWTMSPNLPLGCLDVIMRYFLWHYHIKDTQNHRDISEEHHRRSSEIYERLKPPKIYFALQSAWYSSRQSNSTLCSVLIVKHLFQQRHKFTVIH